jgi:hypothetical protein
MAVTRHALDNRVLCIDDPADFRLFKEEGIEGIICNYPFTPSLHDAALNYAANAIKSPSESEVFRHIEKFKVISSLFNIKATERPSDYYDLSNDQFKSVSKAFKEAAIQEPLQQAIMHMAHCFSFASGIADSVTEIRVNSSFPNSFHVHDPTIVMTLYGEGTQAQNISNQTYISKKSQMFLVGEKIQHRAPEPVNSNLIYRVSLLTYGY